VRAGYSMHGEFWFTVADQGRIAGYAVVTYEPFFDPAGIDAALDYIEDVGSESLGIFIPFPVDTSAILGLDDLQAVRGEYDEPASIMEGPITGELEDDSVPMLSIEWDGSEQIDLPITVFVDGASGSQEIARQTLATESPWLESARVEEPDGLRQAVSITGDHSTDGEVTVASDHTWSAHPAG